MVHPVRTSLLLASVLAFVSTGCRSGGDEEPLEPPLYEQPPAFAPPPLVPGDGGHHHDSGGYRDPGPLLPVPDTPPRNASPQRNGGGGGGLPIPVPAPAAETRGAPPMPTARRRGGTVLFPSEGDRGLMPVASTRKARVWPFGRRERSQPEPEESIVEQEPAIEREFAAMPAPELATPIDNPVALAGIDAEETTEVSLFAIEEWPEEESLAIPVSAVDEADEVVAEPARESIFESREPETPRIERPTFDPNAPLPVIIPGRRRSGSYEAYRARMLRPAPRASAPPRQTERAFDQRPEPEEVAEPLRTEPPRLTVPGTNPFAE